MLFQMAFMAFHTIDCCIFATRHYYYSTLHHFFSSIHLQIAQVNSFMSKSELAYTFLHFFYRRRLMDAYDKDIWDAGRKVVSAIWDALGWIWHGEHNFHSKLYFSVL